MQLRFIIIMNQLLIILNLIALLTLKTFSIQQKMHQKTKNNLIFKIKFKMLWKLI